MPPLKILMLHGKVPTSRLLLHPSPFEAPQETPPPPLPSISSPQHEVTRPPPKKGYTQSGPLFHTKTRALQKALTRAFSPTHTVSFSFPTAPHRLLPPRPNLPPEQEITSSSSSSSAAASNSPSTSEEENFGWWLRTSDGPVVVYDGLARTFAFLAGILRAEGPFDGVIGFSQGAALAGMLASALETDREFPAAELGLGASPFGEEEGEEEEDQSAKIGQDQSATLTDHNPSTNALEPPPSPLKTHPHPHRHPPLKFAIIYSGFLVTDPRCSAFYAGTGLHQTPILHIRGELDSVLEESRSRALVDVCGELGKKVVVHPGGHFVPSQRPWLDAVVGFVVGVLGEVEGRGEGVKKEEMKGKKGESVEDIPVDFPF